MANEFNKVGAVSWFDLTVEKADEVRAFYQAVVGWETSDVSMGDYNDYCMLTPADKQAVAGICHARGVNANLPPQWLVYVTVADVATSVEKCELRGGRVVCPPRDMGDHGTLCVVQDPAGAFMALVQPSQ